MHKKVVALILAFSMMVALLAGCGQQAADESSTVPAVSEASSAASQPAETGEKKQGVINYWSFMNEGEPIQMWMQTFIDDYMKDNPDVKVNVTWSGREVLTKLRTRMSAGISDDFPDVTDQMNDTILDLQNKDGIFLPLDEYMESKAYGSDQKFKDIFIPSILERGRAKDGKLYAIPREVYIQAMFYNTKMFEKYGLEAPKTWDEFLKVCETLKANGIAPIAFDGAFEEYVAWYFTRMSERVVGYDELHKACKGEILWSSNPAFLDIAKKLQELVDKQYLQKNYQGTTWPGAQMLWVQGKAGMFSCGTWLPAELSESTPKDFVMNIFKFPSITGEKYPNYEQAWGNYWTVLKDAPHKDLAVDFIKYTLQKKYDDAKSDLMVPSPLKDGKPVKELSTQVTIMTEAETTGPIYGNLFEYGDYYNIVFNKNANDLMNGNIKADAFIAKMDESTKNYYKNKG